jgi:hypothetical protein
MIHADGALGHHLFEIAKTQSADKTAAQRNGCRVTEIQTPQPL